MKENSLFVEKYRSKTLDEYVGNEQLKQIVEKYINNNDLQNLLLYGTPGTGKTTLAKLIVNNFDCDYLYINASDERGIDTIRDKVQGFASSASFKPIKIIILDEADFLTIQAQASLRNIIETFSRTTRFILTCNYLERIIDPLQSRCQVLKITPPSKKEVAKHTANILNKEDIINISGHYTFSDSRFLEMKKSFSQDIDERIKLAIYQRIDRFIKNSSVDNINTIKKYFVNFENKNIEGLKELFSDDVILADWNTSAKGLPEVVDANINIFNSVSSIKIIQNSTYYNENNKKFACDISIIINDSETLNVVDLIEFDNNGKIKGINAYKK